MKTKQLIGWEMLNHCEEGILRFMPNNEIWWR